MQLVSDERGCDDAGVDERRSEYDMNESRLVDALGEGGCETERFDCGERVVWFEVGGEGGGREWRG